MESSSSAPPPLVKTRLRYFCNQMIGDDNSPASMVVAETSKEWRNDKENLGVVEGSSGQANNNNNPMLIDVVLDNLFGYCEFEDLASHRLVSKKWYSASLQHWLRKAPMLVLPFDRALKVEYSSTGVERTMSRFLGVVHNEFASYSTYEYAGLQQYKKFDIKGKVNLSLHHQLLQQFLRNCGQGITELSLELTFPDLVTYRSTMLSSMSPNVVNLSAKFAFSKQLDDEDGEYDIDQEAHKALTTLKIDGVSDEQPGGLQLPVRGRIQLFKRYPNLKTLTLGLHSNLRAQDIYRMLEAIWTIRKEDKKSLDLKSLMTFVCNEEDYQLTPLLKMLRDTGLRLTNFSFYIGRLTTNETIYETLASQNGSLEELLIGANNPVENFVPPKMDSVEILWLLGYPFQNLRFLTGFPHLATLSFGPCQRDSLHLILRSTTEEHREGLVIPTLTDLKCKYDDVKGNMDPEDIRKLARVMPNINRLKIWLNNESFRAVCECWPRLEELSVVGNEMNDEGISGVVAGAAVRNPSNITNLQGLKSLTMTHFDEDFKENVGFVAITHMSIATLLTLPALEKVEVSMSPDVDVDMKVIKDLETNIRNCRITWAQWTDDESDEEEFPNDHENSESDEIDDDDDDADGDSDDSEN